MAELGTYTDVEYY